MNENSLIFGTWISWHQKIKNMSKCGAGTLRQIKEQLLPEHELEKQGDGWRIKNPEGRYVVSEINNIETAKSLSSESKFIK